MSHRRHAIVLAAGGARRFGVSKLTAGVNGAPLLHHALAAAVGAPVDGITVVTGGHADPVAAAVREFGRGRPAAPPVALVHCDDYEQGVAASLRCGLTAVPANAEAAFLFLGDMPLIPTGLAEALAAALTPDKRAAAPLHDGSRGHPVLIRRTLFKAFATLSGDRGGAAVLDELGPALALVPTAHPGVLTDIDEPEDLARLAASFRSTTAAAHATRPGVDQRGLSGVPVKGRANGARAEHEA